MPRVEIYSDDNETPVEVFHATDAHTIPGQDAIARAVGAAMGIPAAPETTTPADPAAAPETTTPAAE